jgi:hypothetical protein
MTVLNISNYKPKGNPASPNRRVYLSTRVDDVEYLLAAGEFHTAVDAKRWADKNALAVDCVIRNTTKGWAVYADGNAVFGFKFRR